MSAESRLTRQAQSVLEQAQAPLLVHELEARRLLGGLCPKTMFNLRRRHALPFIKIGSRVMYSPADLAAWIERRKGAIHE